MRLAHEHNTTLCCWITACRRWNGLAACQLLRKLKRDHAIDIWFITGHVGDLDIALARRIGAGDLIHKPIHIRPLRQMILQQLHPDDEHIHAA